jgi:N-acetyl sugar amidotransferase
MDTSDPKIEFDDQGICNRCRGYEITHAQYVPPPEKREALMKQAVEEMKRAGKGKDYDCVIGVSGGVDSTYTAWLVKQLGLRPLAVHVDNGWNSNLAVTNIENCLRRLGIDLYTEVLDWDEFRDLQLAFLKASTPDSEIPTDHAILASVMRKAAELGVRHIVWGVNVPTEGLAVPTWSMGHFDWKYIRSVQRQFGAGKLRTFPHFTLLRMAWWRYVRRIRSVYLLNLVDFKKEEAEQVIQREVEYQPYEGKHHESIYTRFFQSYILPRKFGFDKRRAHLSTLIMSGQMTRDAALIEMTREIYPAETMREDKKFVVKKLGIPEAEFDAIMAKPSLTFWDYPSYEKSSLVPAFRKVRAALRNLRRRS